MATIKVGDTVWMPQKIAHVYRGGELKTEDSFVCPPSYVMRDHSALKPIAALLAEHGPALAAALDQSAELLAHEAYMIAGSDVPPLTGECESILAQEALIRLLAAALEGTGDGNEID